MKIFALRDEIVFARSAAADTAPKYLTEESKVVDFRKPAKEKPKEKTFVNVAEIETMLARTKLDPSQQAALAHAFMHVFQKLAEEKPKEKTFVNVAEIETLLARTKLDPSQQAALAHAFRQCCGAGAGGAATFCWSRSPSF
jgi:uncharacterized protein YejL (UPF0352 family)